MKKSNNIVVKTITKQDDTSAVISTNPNIMSLFSFLMRFNVEDVMMHCMVFIKEIVHTFPLSYCWFYSVHWAMSYNTTHCSFISSPEKVI